MGNQRGYWLAASATLALTLLAGCTGGDPPARDPKGDAVPVVVGDVVQKTMAVQIQAVGNVEPYATVAVKARVDGQIERVEFTEGQEVDSGARLFLIDQRPFASQLQQAEANLARSQAQFENARLAESRYLDLIKKKVVSEDQFDQIRTAREAAGASVRADQAAIQTAKLQLEYSDIRSPISGRTGRVLIQRGNLVKANDANPLVVINRLDPIYVTFSVPEQHLGAVSGALESGTASVRVALPGTDTPPLQGKLVFVDNAVDPDTGTIRLKALFDNPDRTLWPGQFVTVVLLLHEQPDALVVPSRAVQTGPKGAYVFVVDAAGSAELRPVTVERSVGTETVVASGVTPGEQVVTVGQWRLRPGAKVNPKAESSSP